MQFARILFVSALWNTQILMEHAMQVNFTVDVAEVLKLINCLVCQLIVFASPLFKLQRCFKMIREHETGS